MYIPSDDTNLLAECAQHYRGRWALEIGIGSGAVAESLAANFKNVVGTDIHLPSLVYCRGRNSGVALVCCDAASPFRNVQFDLVVANPPYLPDDNDKDHAVHGGPTGLEVTVSFIASALPLLSRQGAILVVVSSRADSSALNEFLEKNKLGKKVALKKELFFEHLSVLEITF